MLRPSYTATLRPAVSKFAPLLALLCSAFVGSCSDDGSGSDRGTTKDPDGGATIPGESPSLDAADYCTRICNIADDCDEDFDKQTCRHRCDNQSGSIAKLNPKVESNLYECFDDSECKVVNSDNFVAGCLNDAVEELDVTKAGKAFCAELEEAVDACDFEDDYDESVCLQTTLIFSDDVLDDAKVCAGKKCDLVVECLEATFTLPGELDGTGVGVDKNGKVTSSAGAGSAVAAVLPKVVGASPVSPDVSPDEDPDASVAPVDPDPSDDSASDTSDEPADGGSGPIDTTDEPESSAEPADSTDDSTSDTTDTSEGTIDTSSAPDSTEMTEPVPTDTTDTSEPVPTSDDSTAPAETNTTDTSETVDTSETNTTDTTDTTDTSEAACRQCTDNACSDAVLTCCDDAGCNAVWGAYEACWDAYPYSDQTEARLACLQPTWDATDDAEHQLFLNMLDCYDTVPANECAHYCQ